MITRLSKRFAALLAAALLIACSVTVCFAAITPQYALTDDYGIFSSDEAAEVEKLLAGANKETGWQYIIHTDDRGISSDRITDYYNEEYYDKNSFESDAIMFVYDARSDAAAVITHGDAMQYITDSRLKSMGKRIRAKINSDDFVAAAREFVDSTTGYYKEGVPSNGSYSNIKVQNEKQANKIGYVLSHYGWIIGLVALGVGGAVYGITVARYVHNGKAGTYSLKDNSKTILEEEEDIFVSKHTSVRVIRDSSSEGGSSSGGSSGGGSTHGGGSF